MNRLRTLAAATLLAAAPLAATAGAVTYTFTEYDNGAIVYQLRHTLPDFLDPANPTAIPFTVADIIVDPWAAFGGHTVELDASNNFSALPGYILFSGVDFYGDLHPEYTPHDPGNRLGATSYDMEVQDRTAGSWTAGVWRVDVSVDAVGTPTQGVPAPASIPLVALALAAVALTRRAR